MTIFIISLIVIPALALILWDLLSYDDRGRIKRLWHRITRRGV